MKPAQFLVMAQLALATRCGARLGTINGIDHLDRALSPNEAHSFVKVLTDGGKDTILGMTVAGAHASEMLAKYILAIKHGQGLNKILATIHTDPNGSEANRYTAGECKRTYAPERPLNGVKKFPDWRRG